MLPEGDQRFPKRRIEAIEVEFPSEEQELFTLLDGYLDLRMGSASTPAEKTASRFIALLLKKRLLSSRPRSKHTLDQHIRTLNAASRCGVAETVMREAAAAVEDSADDSEGGVRARAGGSGAGRGRARQHRSRTRAGTVGENAAPGPCTSMPLLRSWTRCGPWPTNGGAEPTRRRGGSRTGSLRHASPRVNGTTSGSSCSPSTGPLSTISTRSSPRRVRAGPNTTGARRGVPRRRLDTEERERIIREFNYNPAKTRVRVLLATDAASEGIDLHRACHRLVHMEIPFNPNRMEQRNGRVDRHGQKSRTVDIFHFASRGGENDSAGHDHSFLLRVAEKVDDIRDDLGSMASVLAERVEARHAATRRRQPRSRRRSSSTPRPWPASAWSNSSTGSRRTSTMCATSTAPASRSSTSPRPACNARWKVAFRIEGQPPLREATLERGDTTVRVFEVDDLAGTWGETLVGLRNEVEDVRLPVTFDPAVAQGHQDVGLYACGASAGGALPADPARPGVGSDRGPQDQPGRGPLRRGGRTGRGRARPGGGQRFPTGPPSTRS